MKALVVGVIFLVFIALLAVVEAVSHRRPLPGSGDDDEL